MHISHISTEINHTEGAEAFCIHVHTDLGTIAIDIDEGINTDGLLISVHKGAELLLKTTLPNPGE